MMIFSISTNWLQMGRWVAHWSWMAANLLKAVRQMVNGSCPGMQAKVKEALPVQLKGLRGTFFFPVGCLDELLCFR